MIMNRAQVAAAEARARAQYAPVVAQLVEALRAMLSEYGVTVGQVWDDVSPTAAELQARAAIARAEGTP